jgi:hypothetical protein
MNTRQIFLRFLAALGVVLLASGILLPRRYNFTYPAALGPVFEPGVKGEHIQGIEKSKPDIVLIGDSVLYEGVDPVLFAEGLGMPVYEMATPGSGTAAWYLQMKNIVFESTHRPKYVFIFFRNTILTVPQYRTTGRYFALLDDYATKNETLVSNLAFVNQMSPLEQFAQRYIPLYTARVDIRDDMDNAIRYIPSSSILNCNRECTQEAVSSIFGREVDPVALNLVQEDASKTLFAQEELDFVNQLDTSLLPHMIELAQKNNVTLVFVRARVFGPEPEMSAYRNALDAYLNGQDGVVLLDFWQDPRIIEAYYVDSLHMNALGKKEFTKILTEEFKAILLK